MKLTIEDIDVQIVAVHWRHLHAIWAENFDEAERAAADLDKLLEERYRTLAPDSFLR